MAAANAGFLPAAGPAPLAYAAAPAPLAYAAPVAKAVVTKEIDPDYDPNPQYSYAYDVHDGLTGDNKQHSESRNGDVVEGAYSFIEADGTRRTVHYTADPVNGFNAVVSKEAPAVVAKAIAPAPLAYHAAPAPAQLAYHAAPAIAHAAPLAYHAAPAYAHAAPLAYSAGPAYQAAAPAYKVAHGYSAPALLH